MQKTTYILTITGANDRAFEPDLIQKILSDAPELERSVIDVNFKD